ncbi:protein NRT1/ PTR FAMILY 5.4-like [Aristolochia californica]|uniref:protein NRT1/ PTR FAMILY 5.4-like n=1 Tax=Aristolochia californica TaxID=171875 RepID=UPI0035E254A9
MEDSQKSPLLESGMERAKKGGWKPAIYIIIVEVLERLAYFGITANLIIYLTSILEDTTVTAAKEINLWTGISTLLCLFGAFIADAYLGRYKTVLLSSLIYILGLVLITLSVKVIPFQFRKTVFFLALYLVAIGQGSHRPSVQALGADQFDEETEEERKAKSSFFNWWFFGVCGAAATAALLIVNIQEHVGWTVGFGISTTAMALSLCIFLIGQKTYRCHPLKGSPVTQVAQVFVAAARKWSLQSAGTTPEHRLCTSAEADPGTGHLVLTNRLKFLDKAAVADEQDIQSLIKNNWRLCSVTQVEEVKQLLTLLPIWLSCLMYGVALAQGTTFFVKQCSTMDTHISSFKLSPASIRVSASMMVLILVPIYDRIFVPVLRKMKGIPAGIPLLKRIGIGIALSIVTLIVAALVEKKRLQVAEEYGLSHLPKATVPMRVWWMVPQYALFAVSDVFAYIGIQEFFYDQMPEGMRSLGSVASLSIVGVGNLLSNLIISVVHQLFPQWLDNNLNQAHLDYFYWLLAGLSVVWLIVYLCLSQCFVYRQNASTYL